MSVVPKRTDYPSLQLGHPTASCTTLHIVGLEVHVFGLEEISSSHLPIACVIACHGRGEAAKDLAPVASGLLGEVNAQSAALGKGKKRDTIVVTMDQRNHGKRLHERRSNMAYDENPRHLSDMAACVVGGCQDVSFIIDFLESYLFPHGEKQIDEWILTGYSLGGNVTWRMVLTDPRIRIAIPTIGLPWTAFARYLGARAEGMGLKYEPPLYPPSLKRVLDVPFSPAAYAGKKILSLHGEVDRLVPFAQGKEDLDGIVAASQPGDVEVWVQEGAGHVVSEDMIRRAAGWVVKWAVAAQ